MSDSRIDELLKTKDLITIAREFEARIAELEKRLADESEFTEWLQGECDKAQDEAARLQQVADAAVAVHIVRNAFHRVRMLESNDYEARGELAIAVDDAQSSLADAVREYRARVEKGE